MDKMVAGGVEADNIQFAVPATRGAFADLDVRANEVVIVKEPFGREVFEMVHCKVGPLSNHLIQTFAQYSWKRPR